MSGFDRVETAQRVRDVLASQARRIVQQEAPRGLVGRVITLDPIRLKGTVWFPGDESPVDVNFFPGTLPASWHVKDGMWTGEVGNSTQGYGSRVVVQRLNGLLYATDILTGGQFGFRVQQLGYSVIPQLPNIGIDLDVFDDNSGIIGTEPAESTIAFQIGDSRIGGLSSPSIIVGPFGPFMSAGSLDVTIVGDQYSGATAKYSVVFNPSDGMVDQWWRVLPEQEMLAAGFTDEEWHFDLSYMKSQYTPDEAGLPDYSLWMRLSQVHGSSAMIYKVIAKTTSFDKVGGIAPNEDFVSITTTQSPEIAGIIGFHNSRGVFEATGNHTFVDKFGRRVTGSWGTTTPALGQEIGLTYTSVGGLPADYYVEGLHDSDPEWINSYQAVHELTTVNSRRRSLISNADYGDVDLTALCEFEDLPTAGNLQMQWITRYKNNGLDQMLGGIRVESTGNVFLTASKIVANVTTVLVSGALALSGVTDGTRIWFRIQHRGNAYKMKAWEEGEDPPRTWTTSNTVSDASLLTPGRVAMSSFLATGTTPVPNKAYYHQLSMQLKNPLNDDVNAGQETWNSGPWRSAKLRLAADLQRTYMIDGNFNWNGTALKWTGSIWMQGVGRNTSTLLHSSAGVQCPASGVGIPVVPTNAGGGELRTATADGIPLNPGDTLYLGIPPGIGGGDDALNPYLFIVESTSELNYLLPEWAVLIAVRNVSTNFGPALRMGDGSYLDHWRLLPFTNGWDSYSTLVPSDYPFVGYKKSDPQTVIMQGMVRHPTATTQVTAFGTLPAGYRPTGSHVFACFSAATGGITRVNLNTLGVLLPQTHFGGGNGAAFIDLSVIEFRLD